MAPKYPIFTTNVPMVFAHLDKIKTAAKASLAERHIFRLGVVHNADPAKANLNRDLLAGSEPKEPVPSIWELVQRRKAAVPHPKQGFKPDQVWLLDGLFACTPKSVPDAKIMDWANDTLNFIISKYRRENVLAAILHLDETNPHIHALFTPVTEDLRFCCKELTSDGKLSKLQDEYAQAVAHYGLVRGKSRAQTGRKVTHIEVKRFYEVLGDHQPTINMLHLLQVRNEELTIKLQESEAQLTNCRLQIQIAMSELAKLETEKTSTKIEIAKRKVEMATLEHTISKLKARRATG